MDARPHVVVIGAGFGGLAAARALARAPARVTVIDRRNHHLFQPLLYQVATAGLAAPDIAAPIRRILRRQSNTTVLLADARRIDRVGRRVLLEDDSELRYDYLIVAAGSVPSYFGHDNWSAHAPALKSIEDAFEIRRRILVAFEVAERLTDAESRRAWLTFAIVGAGPTGVELAGAIREIAQRTLARDFRTFDPRETRVLLIDAADRVLPTFDPQLAAKAASLLARRGIVVRTGARVTEVAEDRLRIGEETIPTRTILWAAGVQANPLARSLEVELDGQGRVRVRADLSIDGAPEVFVVGDLARVEREQGLVPGLAPAAIQAGRHAAANVARLIRGEPTRSFDYHDRGEMATIGRHAGIARVGRVHLSGGVAWLAWLLVHIASLIGFQNRLVVLLKWAWAYVTFQRTSRLIFARPVDVAESVARLPGSANPASEGGDRRRDSGSAAT